MKDFTPVATVYDLPLVLVLNPAQMPSVTDLQKLITHAKARPGQLNYTSSGPGSFGHLSMELLKQMGGFDMQHVPYKGGGEVAVQLVGKHVDSTVNNPIEAVAQWRAGSLRPLCVFDDTRMPYKAKVTDTQSWNDIPTCKEAGVPADYVMLRGIFAAPGISADQLAYYVNLLKKIRDTPDWKEYMEKGAFNQTFLTGADFNKWLTTAETTHRTLMQEAGFLAK